MDGFRTRYLGPVALVSLCLVTLCAAVALSLFRQQATITGVLREDVASRRAATELEECLLDLLALLKDRVESVGALHHRAGQHLRDLRRYANQGEELHLADRLDASFNRYLATWKSVPPAGGAGHEDAVRGVAALLETDVLKLCQEYETFNGRRIEQSTERHELVLRQLSWGMAGVGVLGGGAGLVLGFGVARGLSKSIQRLQVQIRDAAGKLGPRTPEIVLTGEGDFHGLHEQIELLTGRIETVVGELQEREREVLRAEQLAAVGQLAAGVAHEIRNPLTSIKMLVQAGLEESGLPPEDLRVMEGEVRRMEASLQTFLDFARPPKMQRQSADAVELVRGVLDVVRGRADKSRVAVRLDAPAGPVPLVIDAGQVRQVVVNLVLNALDAMPTGGTLRVAVRRAGPGVEVEVADTGPGIAAEVAGRLFQPFVSTKDTGLGLGLVISRRIVEDHGGTLTAASLAGRGATFTVFLPPGRGRD